MAISHEGGRPGWFSSILRLAMAIVVTFFMVIPMLPIACVAPETALRITKPWSKAMLTLFGITLKITDENDGHYKSYGHLFVTLNQTSLTEAFIGSYALPTPYRLVMSLPFALFPFLGWFAWLVGGVVLIPSWSKQAKNALQKAAQNLRSKSNFWMSIEGRRSRDAQISPYKKGPVVMALGAHATIIPIFYRKVRDRLPYGAWRVKPGEAEVIFCKAISTKGYAYEDRDRIIEQLRKIADEKASLTFPP